ncbi:mandelate racemase/muconate lactonizing enzyme family protein [Streptomyces aidingensis]|uniref:L-alanine-DL-glutamate epimerase n=1 Tax=Streptomyces aidingensis TaxID=910347 RepID=A0A1I1KTG6_9ACTN|nr:mandelate racemase/muconate lactonizing enzyme family protein [Streptomyces aidingensis]SFC61988.1 L-alanine-DL-glutamate epimerase [Streptomyces aidingensis]
MSAIEQLGVAELEVDREKHPDTVFLTVQAGGRSGWYGAISARVASYALEVLAPAVVGFPVEDHEGLNRRLVAAIGAGASVEASWAVGAVDCAAWDAHARLADLGVADLLAPEEPSRDVPAYASWLTQELLEADPGLIRRTARDGWLFTKWGLRRRSGISISGAEFAATVARAAEAVQGPVAVDAVGTWTRLLVRAFAERADLSALVWLEDPLPDYRDPGLRCLAEADLPLAFGERLTTADDPGLPFAAARPAALTLDVVGCGGLTRAVAITRHAHAAGIPVYPHGRSLMPALHLAAAFPAAVTAVEYRLQWEPERQLLYDEPLHPEHGHLPRPTRPGLGTEPRSLSCCSTR